MRAIPSPKLRRGIEEIYRAELDNSGRLETPEGALVMALVDRLLDPAGQTPSALAALSKEIRAAFEVAMKGADRQADSGDELQAKRRARILGA
ncbi:MAG TPA: hypothetical protein VKD66_14385 [Streptosporangiaceae bacterium]|nr:hypothetical protein [Streptosporangiaceae bacterium]